MAGDNFILTVTGSGFVPGAVLKWNGAERTPTYVDSSHLTVAIPRGRSESGGYRSSSCEQPRLQLDFGHHEPTGRERTQCHCHSLRRNLDVTRAHLSWTPPAP